MISTSPTNSATTGCTLQNPQTMDWEPVDCGKFDLCGAIQPVCHCTTAACALATPNPINNFASVDVFLAGNTASGTVRLVSGLYHAQFTKN
jgi:hypothetical protein